MVTLLQSGSSRSPAMKASTANRGQRNFVSARLGLRFLVWGRRPPSLTHQQVQSCELLHCFQSNFILYQQCLDKPHCTGSFANLLFHLWLLSPWFWVWDGTHLQSLIPAQQQFGLVEMLQIYIPIA